MGSVETADAASPGSTPADTEALGVVVEQLFASCEQRLGRYLVQLVGDRELAADLLQDTFHEALTTRGHLLTARNREAWLFGIARHRALRSLRRRRRFQRALGRLGSRVPVSDDSEVVALLDLLDRTLSADDRALVLLRYLHGFQTDELAEATGLSADAIRQRLSRATTRVRTAVNAASEGLSVDG